MYHDCKIGIVLVMVFSFLFSGRAPAGVQAPKVYHEGDLKGLVGEPLAQPSYLIGRFLYVGLVQGRQLFATYQEVSGDLITGSGTDTKVAFGKAFISVRFDGDFPPDLVVGKSIAPTKEEPLVLERVMAGPNDFLFVECSTKK
jgi:hypothetical protein